MASRLANSGEVLRSGEAREIPTRRAEEKSSTWVAKGATAPESMNQRTPGREKDSHTILWPRINHIRGVIVTTEKVTAVMGDPWFKPNRTKT